MVGDKPTQQQNTQTTHGGHQFKRATHIQKIMHSQQIIVVQNKQRIGQSCLEIPTLFPNVGTIRKTYNTFRVTEGADRVGSIPIP